MKTEPLNKDTFLENYPEQKPVCLSYTVVREDMLALIEENEALRSQHMTHIKQGKPANCSIKLK